LAVALLIVVNLIFGVLPEAELLPDAWEHEIEELPCLTPQLILIKASKALLLLTQILLGLEAK
jgi:hypothetical protein